MGQVIIGMGPHKRSATIEIINDREKILAQGRFGTDRDGYQTMLTLGRQHKDRVWAVEGCNGIGKHLAQRLVADGETVGRPGVRRCFSMLESPTYGTSIPYQQWAPTS
ncbi:hypothetical protein [Actinoplanes sp. NPDC020271]|uniref:hypothetical protein n=1 Tax=Actinoplanes sp. NPDC020271 TaxID=3363896 RepID=UPI003794BA94